MWERSWRALQGFYMTLSLKETKHVTNDVKFPPVAPTEYKVKPFLFRTTILDSCNKKGIYSTQGSGSFGYLEYQRKRICLFKTNNYNLALSKNRRILDFQPPISPNHDKMDVYQYTVYKLLRRLENFVHFVTHNLAKKSSYILRLSLGVRRLAKNLKFSALNRLFKTIDLKGKKAKPVERVYPYYQISGLAGCLPKAKPIGVDSCSSSELSSDSD